MGTIADLNILTTPTTGDYIVVRTTDPSDKDKKMALGKLPWKDGTPLAGRVARWKDANSLEDGGFAVSDIARLSLAQTFALLQTFGAGIDLGQGAITYFRQSTFLPTLTSDGTVPAVNLTGTIAGDYIRVNNHVLFKFQFGVQSITGGTGNILIGGFPFAMTTGIGFILTGGVDWPSGTSPFMSARSGTATMYVGAIGDNIASATVQVAGVSAGDSFNGFGYYAI